ncbi:hypothetical protein ACIRL3_45875 [Streptomyces sp. NPDC102384]|uniref:hypothetical protein n=1 Tax=Streptomyces sp. NPDC102384 TaxID=3366166 RepID=UPI0037F972B2
MSDDAAYLLARARALRVVPVPDGADVLRRLGRAAEAVERRLVAVAAGDGAAGLLVAWGHDVEPAGAGQEWGGTHREASPSVLLMLGACLRACWTDVDQAPFPGEAAAEEDVLAAVVPPDAVTVREGIAQYAPTAPYRKALRVLRACGYLAADAGDGMVRLGPVVAAWPERDVDELRRGYPLLPHRGEG